MQQQQVTMHVSEHHVHHRTNLTEWLVFVRGHAKFAIVAESFDKCRILNVSGLYKGQHVVVLRRQR